mmetsp:Transcript_37142/g.94871  ORF Transcript_37142/g.94871 Transcript_37142/m.94871 type:complete len:439 (-) Transcript_37142:89-1405(-)
MVAEGDGGEDGPPRQLQVGALALVGVGDEHHHLVLLPLREDVDLALEALGDLEARGVVLDHHGELLVGSNLALGGEGRVHWGVPRLAHLGAGDDELEFGLVGAVVDKRHLLLPLLPHVDGAKIDPVKAPRAVRCDNLKLLPHNQGRNVEHVANDGAVDLHLEHAPLNPEVLPRKRHLEPQEAVVAPIGAEPPAHRLDHKRQLLLGQEAEVRRPGPPVDNVDVPDGHLAGRHRAKEAVAIKVELRAGRVGEDGDRDAVALAQHSHLVEKVLVRLAVVFEVCRHLQPGRYRNAGDLVQGELLRLRRHEPDTLRVIAPIDDGDREDVRHMRFRVPELGAGGENAYEVARDAHLGELGIAAVLGVLPELPPSPRLTAADVPRGAPRPDVAANVGRSELPRVRVWHCTSSSPPLCPTPNLSPLPASSGGVRASPPSLVRTPPK